MCDTLKIPRPLFCRRQDDLGGRPTVDPNGAKMWAKTRFADTQEFPELVAAESNVEMGAYAGANGC